MKKVRRIFSLAFALITVAFTTLLAACAKESTIYLTVKSDDGEFNPLWLILIGVVVVVVLLVVLKILSNNKKKQLAAEQEEQREVLTQDPNAVSEYFFGDEQPVENTEEKSAEEEENEEAENEEAEEESSESESAEETEEKAYEEVEEATENEETEPEEIVEDVADASFVEETEEKAEVAEETVEDETEEIVDETEELAETEEIPTYTLDENGLPVAPDGMVIRYKWSCLGRLIQSDDELKYRYMMLRRKLLSYKKVRSNVSWNFDSYFIGRKPIVKLKVRGKTLVAYFPIDPQEMAGTKYVGEDFSDIARYKAVPFAYRINGARKLKYAIELIEKQLEGVKSTEPEYLDKSQVNEAIPRESFKKLFEKGYIRVGGILAVGERASAKDEDDEDQIDVVDTETDEEIAPSPLREVFNFNPKSAQ